MSSRSGVRLVHVFGGHGLPRLVLLVLVAVAAALVGFSSGAETSVAPAAGAKVGERELPELRTRTSRTVQTEEGTFKTTASASSIHFRAGDGAWRPIDNRMTRGSDGRFRNAANRFSTEVPASLAEPVRVTDGSRWVSFRLRGATGTGAADGATVRFADAIEGVDVSYTAEGDGLKELLTLPSAASPSSFVFELAASSGLTPALQDDGGLSVRDASGSVAFSVPAPVMWDSATSRSTSRRVSFDLSPEGEGWLLRLTADRTWLEDPDRVFPVQVDPTTAVSAAQDCFVSSSSPDGDFCPTTYLLAGRNTSTRTDRSLLKFDVSAIRRDAMVLASDLAIYNNAGVSQSIDVHRVCESWTTNVTWNKRDGSTGWDDCPTNSTNAAPGASFESTVEDTNPTVGGGAGWEHFHPTELVEDWIAGTHTNNGLLLKASDESTVTGSVGFDSSSGTNPPSLTVEWERRRGLEGRWTYDTFKLSDRAELYVNVASGLATVHERDLTLQGTGLDLTVDRWANIGAGYGGAFGHGWSLGTSRDIYLKEEDEGETVIFDAPRGAQMRFRKIGTNTYKAPPGLNATLVKDANDSNHFKLTFHRSREVWRFNTNGILKTVTDKNGHQITFSYPATSAGRQPPGTITDTQGRQVTFSANNEGRVTGMDAPGVTTDRRAWTYGYQSYSGDPSFLLSSYENARADDTIYTYSANGTNLIEVTDGRGNKTKIAYDSNQRVTSVIRVTNTSAGTGPTTTYDYDWANRKTTVTDPRGSATTTVTTDGKTIYEYDPDLQVTKVTDALGHTRDRTYTPNGDADSFTETPGGTGNASINTLTYDLSGGTDNVTGGVGAEGETFSIGYWTQVADTPREHDSLSKYLPRQETGAQDTDTFYAFDPVGNLTDVKDDETSAVNKATLAYTNTTDDPNEPKGLLKSATDGRGKATGYEYSTAGNLLKITPPTPDPNNPLIGSTEFTYDASSRVATVDDGKGQVQTFTYDALDRVTKIAFSDSKWTEYDYDANGNVTQRRFGTGTTTSETTSYVYDALNRRTQETFPGSKVHNYTYDLNSQLDTFEDSGGVIDYSYDQIDRVASIEFPSTTSPTSTRHLIDVDYDDNLRQRTITYPTSLNTAGAKVIAKTDLSGKTTLIKARNSTDTADLAKLEYTYKRAGGTKDRLLRHSETVDGTTTTTYAYDDLDRLCWSTQATVTNFACGSTDTHTSKRLYTFDAASNRLSKKVGSTTTSYAYNEANQLCWSYTGTSSNTCGSAPTGATTYAFDDNGNMTAAGSQSYGYDVRDRLTTIGTSALSYLAPTNGELVDVAGTSYQNSLLGLTRRGGSTPTYYLRTPDGEFLMERKSTGNYPIVPDALGSTRWMLSGDTVARSYTYDPDGNIAASSGTGPDSEIRFAGGHRVSTGGAALYHFGRRYYDPAIARWTQADPLDQASDLRQANRYVYAGSDPVNLSDASGEAVPLLAWGVAAAVRYSAVRYSLHVSGRELLRRAWKIEQGNLARKADTAGRLVSDYADDVVRFFGG